MISRGEAKSPIDRPTNELSTETNPMPRSAGSICIALCDDNSMDLAAIKTVLEKFCGKSTEHTFQIFSFNNPSELMEYIKKNGGFDILLLDIYMPGRNGTQVAEELRKSNDHCEIIFITTSDDHARDAYKVNAIQYIKKPASEDELFNALHRAIIQLGKNPSKMLFLKTTDGMLRVRGMEIICTKSQTHYQYIYLVDGTKCKVRMTVGELFETLSSVNTFMRIGAAYIVAVRHIVSLDVKKITMKNEFKIPLPRNTYRIVKQKYLDLLFEEI
jgi:DNA-binding LytR/AlgR family response regulator